MSHKGCNRAMPILSHEDRFIKKTKCTCQILEKMAANIDTLKGPMVQRNKHIFYDKRNLEFKDWCINVLSSMTMKAVYYSVENFLSDCHLSWVVISGTLHKT